MATLNQYGVWEDPKTGQRVSGKQPAPNWVYVGPPTAATAPTSRTLDVSAPSNVSPPRSLPETGTGNVGADSLYAGQMAGSMADTSAYQKFGLSLMDLLKRYQGMGTKQFQEAAISGGLEQVNRVMKEAEPGMPPSMQSQIRSAQAGAVEPKITGAEKLGQTFSEQLASFGSALEQARAIGEFMVTEEENRRKEAINWINSFPDAVKQLDDASKKELAKRAGISVEFLDALPEGEKWEQITLSDGSLAQRNTKTGEINVLIPGKSLGGGIGGISDLKTIISELPAGQQDAAYGAIASFKNAKDILDLLDKGVSTGPISGLTQGISQKFGTSAADFDKLQAAMTSFSSNFIKGISGVAVSEQEYQRLMKALPSVSKQENVNRNVLKQLVDTIKNKYELQLGINFADYPDEIPSLYSIGDIVEKNGKKYKYLGNDQWEEL